jgi:MOSC domain-containing protein YiiM
MSAEQGVHGDMWLRKGTPHIDAQVMLINTRAIDLLARTPDRWALAGDQLYVDLDLSEDNLQAGQRLAVGSTILEVTSKPHKGCAKFAQRFGQEALEFVNAPQGWQLHLRGICARVVQDGTAKVGDRVVGSGIILTDAFDIVSDNEHAQNQFMIEIVLGKRQSLAHESRETLPEGIVPTLHMIRLATVFADRLMLACRKDLLVGVPEIATSATTSVGFGEPLP